MSATRIRLSAELTLVDGRFETNRAVDIADGRVDQDALMERVRALTRDWRLA